MSVPNELLNKLDKLHTTELGVIRIKKNLSLDTDDVVEYDENGNGKLRDSFKDVKHYVFIDDLCGSGKQATSNDSNVKRCVQHLRNIVKDAKISYFMIFGMSKGIKVIRDSGLYNQANAVVELDESYRCFSEQSRFFDDDKYIDKCNQKVYINYIKMI